MILVGTPKSYYNGLISTLYCRYILALKPFSGSNFSFASRSQSTSIRKSNNPLSKKKDARLTPRDQLAAPKRCSRVPQKHDPRMERVLPPFVSGGTNHLDEQRGY